jgi:hypothetical protein
MVWAVILSLLGIALNLVELKPAGLKTKATVPSQVERIAVESLTIAAAAFLWAQKQERMIGNLFIKTSLKASLRLPVPAREE